MQVVNVFLCRDPYESLLRTGVSGNWLILTGIVVELALIWLIDYTPPGNSVFGTAPIPVSVWIAAMAFGLVMLLLEECRKTIVRRWKKSTYLAPAAANG